MFFFEGRIGKVDTAGELFEMFVAANLRPKEQLRLQPQRQMHWSANHAPLAVAGPVQSLCKCCMVLFHVNVGSTCLTASSCEPGVRSHFEALQSCKVFVKYDDKKRPVLLMQGLCLRYRKGAGRHSETAIHRGMTQHVQSCSVLLHQCGYDYQRLMEYVINC
jgi:hypothetical protein